MGRPERILGAATGKETKRFQQGVKILNGILKGNRWVRPSCGVVFTWHVPKRVMDRKLIAALDDLHYCQGTPSESMYAEVVRKTPSFHELWTAFVNRMPKVLRNAGAKRISMSAEVSQEPHPQSKMHLHIAASVADVYNSSLTFDCAEDIMLYDAAPDIQRCTKKGEKSFEAAHAYLQIPKTGKIISESNWEYPTAFICKPQWVTTWLAKRKITTDAAKSITAVQRTKVRRTIQDITDVENIEREEFAKKVKTDVEAGFDTLDFPMKHFPEIDEWKLQFAPGTKEKKRRFNCLVLHGKSKLGKTELAVSLFGRDQTLVVDCENALEPLLKGFSMLKHKAILFDECNANMVARHKKVFQSTIHGAWLGQSKCQQHAYQVFLWGVPLIVCTNEWIEEADPPLDKAKKEWLEDNCTYIRILEKVYVEDSTEKT